MLKNSQKDVTMNLNHLKYFITLAKLEHFTKAAEELEITQPTLSHSMATLEQELGTRLFQKQGRGVGLTKYGRTFLKYAEESLSTLEEGIRKTKEMTGHTGGIIDLAFIYTLGSEFVPNMVSDFLRSHEELNIRFHFTVGNTTDILKGLKDEKFDVAFCSMVEKESHINFAPVGTEELVLVTPKGHPIASSGNAISLEEAAKYPQIFFTENSGLRPLIDNLFEQADIKPEIAYEIEEDSCMAGLIARGFGIGIMPDIPVLRTMDVDVLPLNLSGHRRYVYMAWCPDNYHPPAVKQFIKYVANAASFTPQL